jgi:acetyltransferase EpsM
VAATAQHPEALPGPDPVTPSIVLIGGGGHARVVADAFHAEGRGAELAGYLDWEPSAEMTTRTGLPYLGPDEGYRWNGRHGILCFGGLDGAAGRREAVRRLATSVGGWASVIHPDAVISAKATIGEGSVVCAGVIVNTGARIGAHSVINTGAVVEHDVVLGEHVQVSPGAILGGGVSVGAGGYVGLGAVLRDHVTVGDGAVVGMGSVVTKDVPARMLAVGHPARFRSLR